jgi:uncharacterized pyridoxal phosphate-containing UPF0001 family protein
MLDRREFLRTNIAAMNERIDAARRAAGRTDSVDLVVVTKTYPASDVDLLADLGIRDVGENRDQEAKAKKLATTKGNLRWHMIGRLQRNKVNSVARWADVVESVDREVLVTPLADAVWKAGREGPLQVLIQVDLESGVDDPDTDEGTDESAAAERGSRSATGRGGAPVGAVTNIAAAVDSRAELELAGVMAVAPHPDTGIDPLAAFTRLAQVAADLRARWPRATTISAGMSQDLEQAIACGATQVRVGGAILGQRASVQ